MNKLTHAFVVLSLTVAASAHAAKKSADPKLIEKGKASYNANCIACHNADPSKDGILGPAVSGSSAALIEARIMKSAYPKGYKPKRDTKTMVALPHLKSDLKALSAYLGSMQ